MRKFVPCIIPDGESGKYKVHTEGGVKCLDKIHICFGRQTCIIDENLQVAGGQYNDFLQDATGKVLFIGMGLNLIAQSLEGLPDIVSMDCVEIETDIVTLCSGTLYNNVYTSDVLTWAPPVGIKWDTIIVDCFNSKGRKGKTYRQQGELTPIDQVNADYGQDRQAVIDLMTPLLETGGNVYAYRIPD